MSKVNGTTKVATAPAATPANTAPAAPAPGTEPAVTEPATPAVTAAASSKAVPPAAGTATMITPKTDTTNVYSRTIDSRISNASNLFRVTMDRLDDLRTTLTYVDWDKMKEGHRTKKDYERKIAQARKSADKYKQEMIALKEKKIKLDAEHKFNTILPPASAAATTATTASHPGTAGTTARSIFQTPQPGTNPNDGRDESNPSGSSHPMSPVTKRLFTHMIFTFSKDQSALARINALATQPINYSDPNDVTLIPSLGDVGLATLDPVTTDELHAVAHELHLVDLNLLEVHEKLEAMENPHYVAKVTRTKSELQVINALKNNPKTKAFSAEFLRHAKDFQTRGTAVIKKSVEFEQEFYQQQAAPKLLHNLFRLCKTFATSRSPQSQVLILMDIARKRPATTKQDIPESTDLIAGYALLLLLTTSSCHVLTAWSGADSPASLFDMALKTVTATPSPCTSPPSAPESPPRTATDQTGTSATDADATEASSNYASDEEQTQEESSQETSQETSPEKVYPSFDYTTPTSPDVSTPPSDNVVLLGTKHFPMISAAAWDIASSIATDLGPLANYITMERRGQLIKKITRSKCMTAVKSLSIRRETLQAATSIFRIIQESKNNERLVLSTMAKWRRELFAQTRSRTNRFLERHRGLQSASVRSSSSASSLTRATNSNTRQPPEASAVAAKEPEVISLLTDSQEQLSQLSSPATQPSPEKTKPTIPREKKRQGSGAPPHRQRQTKRPKNSEDGQLKAPAPSKNQGQKTIIHPPAKPPPHSTRNEEPPPNETEVVLPPPPNNEPPPQQRRRKQTKRAARGKNKNRNND
jgi:hypothetical protein